MELITGEPGSGWEAPGKRPRAEQSLVCLRPAPEEGMSGEVEGQDRGLETEGCHKGVWGGPGSSWSCFCTDGETEYSSFNPFRSQGPTRGLATPSAGW